MKRRKRRLIRIAAAVLAAAAIFVYMALFNGSLVYFTSGFDKHDLLEAGSQKAYDYEAQILFYDIRVQYEMLFGSDVWERDIDGQSFESYAKDQVRTKLIRVAYMNELAGERGVVLNRDESANVVRAAKEYLNGMQPGAADSLGITQEKLENMYTKFAIANRLYSDMTDNLKLEISADYARVITIQYVSAETEQEINDAAQRLAGGESFLNVARTINNGGGYECELKRGDMEQEFEDAAFELASGETSGIVSAGGRYYIIRCVSDNEKSRTEANRNDIIEKRKLEEFNSVFEQYESSVYMYFNQKLWDNLQFASVDCGIGFEDIFNKYF